MIQKRDNRNKQKIAKFLNSIGFDPLKTISFIKGLSFYKSDLKKVKKQRGSDTSFAFGPSYPILNERHSLSGTMSGHYFHQDLFIARRIFENNPVRHIDIGSRIDGFVAHVAVFREIELFDIRSQNSNVKNIRFTQADLMNLPDNLYGCCDSVSSLHAIEHFGLGRYGDPVDYEGHIKAIYNINKMLKNGGKFYFSVPIGKQRIEFNAHRVFNVTYLIELLNGKFRIDSFSYVDDVGNLHIDVELNENRIKVNFDCMYGCGIFELTKI